MSEKKIAIIAAMEREVRPLIRGWKSRTMERGGRVYRLFEDGGAVLLWGGIGAEAARRATEAVIEEVNPGRVISAGFAGALNPSLSVGDVLEPLTVINAADGARTQAGSGEGILVSSAAVAGQEQKAKLSKAYGAAAVDMEAAAVAQGAQARGVEFGALKAISDGAGFNLPAMDRFIANDGSFHSVRFACHVVLRPWLWATAVALARNSSKASHALCDALTSYLHRESLKDNTFGGESLGFEPNPKKVDPEFASVHTSAAMQSHTRSERR